MKYEEAMRFKKLVLESVLFSKSIPSPYLSQNMCFMFEFGEVFSKVKDCFDEQMFDFRKLHIDIMFLFFHRDRKIAK